MADTRGERITDTFQFKHHALPDPEITATNRMIDATTRLTAAIAGIQEAPPNEMEAIQSLCTLLLSKSAPILPPLPIVLPTLPVVAATIDNKPITILNPPRKFTHLRLHTNTLPLTLAPTVTILQSSKTTVTTTHLPPFTSHACLDTIVFTHCKNILSHAIN
jgi:hypothetical protein